MKEQREGDNAKCLITMAFEQERLLCEQFRSGRGIKNSEFIQVRAEIKKSVALQTSVGLPES